MTRAFWMMATLSGVILPAFTLMSGGGPFPAAPASATFDPPPQLVFRRDDDAQLAQVVGKMGFVSAPVIEIRTGDSDSSWSESPAGREWTERLSLERLHQEFKAACNAPPLERRAIIEGVERQRDAIRAQASTACGWLIPAADKEHELMFCKGWRC